MAGPLSKIAAKAVRAAKVSEPVLPLSQSKVNLEKFLEPSKAQMRLYHGTMATEGGKREEALKTLKPSREGALGSGVYLTPQSEFASTYAGFPARSQLERDIVSEDDFARQSATQLLDRMNRGAVESHEIGGNMIPVYAQLRNPLILEGKGDPMIEALVKLGMDEQSASRLVEKAYEDKGYIGKQVENRARAAGYDGLMQYRDGNLNEVVVYNPNAVKSAIGNQGTYDTSKKELSKAKGGAVNKPLSSIDGMKEFGDALAKKHDIKLAGGGYMDPGYEMPVVRRAPDTPIDAPQSEPTVIDAAAAILDTRSLAPRRKKTAPQQTQPAAEKVAPLPPEALMAEGEYLRRLQNLRLKSGRRPEHLNQSGDVNAPFQLARGWAAGTLGLPGDIEGLVRLLPGLDETPILPTSDYFKEKLPGYDPKPFAQALGSAGSLFGGLGVGTLAKTGMKGAKAAGTALGPKASTMAEDYLMSSGLAPAVIKPKGGNWLTGDVEKQTSAFKSRGPAEADRAWFEKRAEAHPEEYRIAMETIPRTEAINNWIDKKLNKYIKNEMGTPEDPVRDLAERDVLHFEPQQGGARAYSNREVAGMSTAPTATTPLGINWENLSDAAILSGSYAEHIPLNGFSEDALRKLGGEFAVKNPQAMAYSLNRDFRDLGFDHLIDELRNAMNPNSGLPRSLQWTPKDLEKVTVPQAVERVAKINEWRMKQKAEANEALARNPATVDFKTYDTVPGTDEVNKRGLAWKEIKAPDFKQTPIEERKEIIARLTDEARQKGLTPEDYIEKYPESQLAAALKYEGEVMGHCVGGYCDDVLSGRSKIYSLRDAKGEPHVTIEVQPSATLTPEKRAAQIESLMHRMRGEGMSEEAAMRQAEKLYPESETFSRIVQIKGKGNRKPDDKYLPFVQDFVKSGNWSSVGDLSNTGLRDMESYKPLRKYLENKGINVPRFITEKDYLKFEDDFLMDRLYPKDDPRYLKPAEGQKAGGDVHMQAGGLAKIPKTLAKSKKEPVPLVLPEAPALTKVELRPIAQRMAQQMTSDFFRPDPTKSVNPAGKSKKVFEREKDLPVGISYKVAEKPAPVVDMQEHIGSVMVGLPGDPSVGGVVTPGTLSEMAEGAAELKKLGDVELEHGVQLFGGPRFGAFSPELWSSGLGAARAVQNRADALYDLYGVPILGQYIKMSPESTNYALHNLDALLAYQQPERLGKSKIELLNREIIRGSPKYGKFPGFIGFEDPVDVLLQSQLDQNLRKHIAETLMKSTITDSLGLRPGSDVLFGISEPSLRNLETGVSGYSIGRLKPKSRLEDYPTSHPTYDVDIPGVFLGQSRYPIPAEVAFPNSMAYARSQLKPGVQEFNMLKFIGPREVINQKYIDQLKMFEDLMKEYTGKKKGGAVRSGLSAVKKRK